MRQRIYKSSGKEREKSRFGKYLKEKAGEFDDRRREEVFVFVSLFLFLEEQVRQSLKSRMEVTQVHIPDVCGKVSWACYEHKF